MPNCQPVQCRETGEWYCPYSDDPNCQRCEDAYADWVNRAIDDCHEDYAEAIQP